jgi:hypothetical protein
VPSGAEMNRHVGPTGHGRQPVDVEGNGSGGGTVQRSTGLVVPAELAGRHRIDGLVRGDVDRPLGGFNEAQRPRVQASLLEAEPPHLPGEYPDRVELTSLVAPVPALEQEALSVRQPPGNERATGSDVRHPPAQRRLSESHRQTLGDVETAIGLRHLSRLHGRPPPQEVCFGDERRIRKCIGDLQKLGRVTQSFVEQARRGGREIAGHQDPGQRRGVTRRAGEPDGFVAERQAAAPVSGEDQLDPQGGEEGGASAVVRLAGGGDGDFQHRHLLLVDAAERRGQEAPRVGQRGPGHALGVTPPAGQVGRLEQGLAMGRIAGPALGFAQ